MAFLNVSGSNVSDLDGVALMSTQLQAAIAQFRRAYPSGSLITEWVTVHAEQCVVRAIVQVGTMPLGSAMAMGNTVEQAEDRAKLRAIATVLSPQAELHGSPSSWLSSPSSSASPSWPSPVTMPLSPSVLGTKSGDRPPVAPTSTSSNPSIPSVSTEGHSPQEPPQDVIPPNDLHAPESFSSEPFSSEPFSSEPFSSEPFSSEPFSPEPQSGQGTKKTTTPRPSATSQGSASRSSKKPSKKKAPSSSLADTESSPAPQTAPPSPDEDSNPALTVDLSEIIAKTSVELRRLGWTDVQGREHLERVYGKRSRQQLTDPELLDFLTYLESQPTPS